MIVLQYMFSETRDTVSTLPSFAYAGGVIKIQPEAGR